MNDNNEPYFILEENAIKHNLPSRNNNDNNKIVSDIKYCSSLEEKVEQGDSQAMFDLGNYYKNLFDFNRMYENYNLAYENGNIDAAIQIAIINYVKNKYYIMEEYLIKASEQNSSLAIFILANYYYMNKEYNKMEEYFKKGEQLNDTKSIYCLAFYYEQNNDPKAEFYYMRSHELDNNNFSLINLIEYYKKINKIDKMVLYYNELIQKSEKDYNTLAKEELENYKSNNYKQVNKYYILENNLLSGISKNFKFLRNDYDNMIKLHSEYIQNMSSV